MDVIFKSFPMGASASVSSVCSPFTNLWWCFKALELFQVSFFTILCIVDRLILICLVFFLGAKCVLGRFSCDQTNLSIKSMFSSIETALACLIHVFYPLNMFLWFFSKGTLLRNNPIFLMDGSSKFFKLTSFFLRNCFQWLFSLHLKNHSFLLKIHTLLTCRFDL